MNPRWRMLLWEQCRLILPAFIVLYALFAAGLFGGRFLALSFWAYEDLTGVLLLSTSIAFIGILLVRRNQQGRITLTFDTRYFQLPVRTVELVAFFLGLRLVFFLLFITATLFTGRLISDVLFTFKILGIILSIFCWVQIYAWCWKAYRPFLIVLATITIAAFFYYSAFWWVLFDSYDSITLFATTIPLLFLSLCFSAIHRQRTEMIITLPRIDPFSNLVAYRKTTSLPPFKSPLEAQFWYETRNMGKLLLATSGLAVLLFVSLCVFSAPVLYEFDLFDDFREDVLLTTSLLLPAVILALAAFIIGSLVLQKNYCSYPFRHPLSNGTLTLAKAMALVKMMSLLSVGLMLFLFLFSLLDSTGFLILVSAYRANEIDIIYILALVVRPTLFFTCVAWLILWWRTRALLLLLAPLPLFLVFPNGIVGPSLDTAPYFLFLLAFYVLLAFITAVWRIKTRKIYSTTQIRQIIACLITTSLTGFLFLLYTTHHPGKALFLAVFISLLFLPILTAPLELQRQRAE